MSDINYFQVKIKRCETRAVRLVAEDHGLSSWAWVIRSATWCEDYFDLDKKDIETVIDEFESSSSLLMELGDEDLVDLFIRRVPGLVRQGNMDKGFIVPDDIAYQMTSELEMLAEEGIPPGTGDAINWFREAIAEFAKQSAS